MCRVYKRSKEFWRSHQKKRTVTYKQCKYLNKLKSILCQHEHEYEHEKHDTLGVGNSTLPIVVPNRLPFLFKTISTYIPSKHEICILRQRSATPLTLSILIYNNRNHIVFYVLFTQAYLVPRGPYHGPVVTDVLRNGPADNLLEELRMIIPRQTQGKINISLVHRRLPFSSKRNKSILVQHDRL